MDTCVSAFQTLLSVEIINLQPRDGGMAKPYQVRQVRDIILKYRLAGDSTA
jgi:hypothetical protein